MDYLLKTIVLLIFVITYILMIKYYDKKSRIIWASVLFLLVFGALNARDAFFAINWNVIGLYFGMLFISEAFIISKIPDFFAIKLVNRMQSVSAVFLSIAFLAGLLSIALENVAVVLIIAPIALSITKKLKVSPVIVLISIALMSNLQGAATLIGDPPSMLLAGFAKFTFNDFFILNGKPSLFFAIQAGAVASLFVLYFFFKKYRIIHKKLTLEGEVYLFPGVLIIVFILLLALFSLTDKNASYSAGVLSLLFGAISLLWVLKKQNWQGKRLLNRLDWETGIFLAGVFILVSSLIRAGITEDIVRVISASTGSNVLFTYCAILFVSIIFSAFIDNVPYIAVMLPVVHSLASVSSANPVLYYFALLIGASIGGNITPIGASTNIVAMGIAEKEGYKHGFFEFVKIGLPFTIASTLVSALFIYLVFS